MWGQKLCIGLSTQFGDDFFKQLKLIKKAGFDGFFVNWEDYTRLDELKKAADELDLIFQSVHAPFVNVKAMWSKGEETGNEVGVLLDCLNACAENDVPIMVCHAIIGFDEHSPNEYGIENFAKIVKASKKSNVKIAFENTEGEEYLKTLMDAFCGYDNVGFCWDTGHEMCYNHSKDMLKLYGDRLICTHINDNLGISSFDGKIFWTDDLHLLPFDGIADWEDIVKRLNIHGYNDCLTFELNRNSKPDRHDNDIYLKMTIEEYLTESYKRACRVAALKSRINVHN